MFYIVISIIVINRFFIAAARNGSATFSSEVVPSSSQKATTEECEDSICLSGYIGIGVGVGAAVVLAIGGGILLFCCCRRRAKKKEAKIAQEQQTPVGEDHSSVLRSLLGLQTTQTEEMFTEENLDDDVRYRRNKMKEEKDPHPIQGVLPAKELNTLFAVLEKCALEQNDKAADGEGERASEQTEIILLNTNTANSKLDQCPSDQDLKSNSENDMMLTPLRRMMNTGGLAVHVTATEIADCLDAVTAIVAAEPTLVDIAGECLIFGAVKGQCRDVHRLIQMHNWPVESTTFIFLGDLTDCTGGGLMTLMLLLELKRLLPRRVVLLRGKIEQTHDCPLPYSLRPLLSSCFAGKRSIGGEGDDVDVIMHKLNRFYSLLPLAALLGGRVLCVHGGVSDRLHGLDDIRAIRRPLIQLRARTLAHDLVHSAPDLEQPTGDVADCRIDKYGNVVFNRAMVQTIFERLDLDMIIATMDLRTYQGGFYEYSSRLLVVDSAPSFVHTFSLRSVRWSVRRSRDEEGERQFSYGAAVHVSGKMQLTIGRLRPSFDYAKKRVQQWIAHGSQAVVAAPITTEDTTNN